MTSSKTLVVASGVLLRAEPASERSTLLVEVRPGAKPKTWRAVPNEDVEKHAQTWAVEHGITLAAQVRRGPVSFTIDLDRVEAVGVIAEALRGHVK